MIEEQQRSQIWNGESSPPGQADWYAMDISPRGEDYSSQPMEIQSSPMVQEHPARPPIDPDSMNPSHVITAHEATAQSPGNKLGKFGSLGFGRKSNKWGLGMFGNGDKGHTLPPVDEMAIAASSTSTPSLKRTQSSSTDSRSLSEMSPIQEVPTMDPKKAKKEAERLQREANKQRRALAEKAQREQARAVMQKRNQIVSGASDGLNWGYHPGSMTSNQRTEDRVKTKHGPSSGPIRQSQVQGASGVGSATVNAAAGRFDSSSAWRRDGRLPKARRREFDDDHSMSSSDVHSVGRVSAMSFATVDSDPGPTVPRRPSLLGINRMTSRSSLRTGTSFDDFPSSARSSNSFSVGESLAHDFHIRATVDGSMLPGTISPPPIQTLSLSPSPTWMHESNDRGLSSRRSSYISKPPTIPEDASSDIIPGGPYYPHESSRSHSSSPRGGPHITINPMFKVPTQRLSSPPALPPFSQLEAVAEGEYPPLSPMSFHSPEDS
jgi:meiosis induction protein kinase IME2/SME1